jgi:uncharacterized caspase-like protein
MHKFIVALVFGLLMLFPNAGAGAAARRVALVIGNSAYQSINALPNPARDAEAVADLFTRLGFDRVQLARDADIKELRRLIGDFAEVARDADVAVVFFAGHGIEVGGTNFLIPVDARLERDFDVEDEALSLDRILRALESTRQLRLIMLDACRENPFVARMKRLVTTRTIGRGLSRSEPAADTLVAYAARAGTVAQDGTGRHSPFTTALLRHLAVPSLDLRLAFGRIRDDVLQATGNRQEPFVYGSLGGSVVALSGDASNVSGAVAAAPASDGDANLRGEYALAVRIGTIEALDAFLARNPNGFFADLARSERARRAKLDDVKSAAPPAQTQAPGVQAPPTIQAALPPASEAAPPGFEAFRGKTFEVSFRQVVHEISPRPGSWAVSHRHKIDVRSENEIADAGKFVSEFTGISRSFDRVGSLSGTDALDQWSVQDGRLIGTLRRRIFLLKLTIRLVANGCVATASFESSDGGKGFKGTRWKNGEPFTADWIRAEKVACRIAGDAPAVRRVQ